MKEFFAALTAGIPSRRDKSPWEGMIHRNTTLWGSLKLLSFFSKQLKNRCIAWNEYQEEKISTKQVSKLNDDNNDINEAASKRSIKEK